MLLSIALGAFHFFSSKLGLYVMVGLAVMAALWGFTHHERNVGFHLRDGEVAAYLDQIQRFEQAGQQAEEAQAKLALEQAASVQDLQMQLEKAQKGASAVNSRLAKEVIRVSQEKKSIDAACTVPNAFVWVRDTPLHPEYADLAIEASAAALQANSGLSATDVATTDAALIQNSLAMEWNLKAWEDWYQKNAAAFQRFQKLVDTANKSLR